MKAKEKAIEYLKKNLFLCVDEDIPKIRKAIKESKKEFSDKIKKGITKMEKDGHKLPRRNIHYMIDLLLKKHLK